MDHYDRTAVEASHAVLIDALTVLGRYAGHLVIIGGWVPELTFPGKGHIGSLDVDLAIDANRIGIDNAYTTIRNLLLTAGYRTTDLPNRFARTVTSGGKVFPVTLDLVTGDRDAADPNRPRQVQEMPLANLRGVDLAFDFVCPLEITGTLPEGGRNTIQAQICDARAFLCMKGIALHERKKEKDAYDIYFILRQYPGGPAALAEAFRPVLAHPLVDEGLRKLRSKFSTVDDIGPVWAAKIEEEQGGDREFVQRDAFERADVLLRALKVRPWSNA